MLNLGSVGCAEGANEIQRYDSCRLQDHSLQGAGEAARGPEGEAHRHRHREAHREAHRLCYTVLCICGGRDCDFV